MQEHNKLKNILPVRAIALVLVIALVFLSGCLGGIAPGEGQESIWTKFNEWFGPWMSPMAAAFGIGIAIVVFAWMYASFMMDEKIKAWAKSEAVQLGYSAVILMAVITLIISMTHITATIPAYTPLAGNMGNEWSQYVNLRCAVDVEPSRPCHIRVAEDYLEILAKSTQGQALSVVRYEAFLYQISSIGLDFRGIAAPGGDLTLTPFAGLTPVVETLSFAFDLLMKNLMAIRAQQFILDFLHLAFFPFFLCAGIFFRTFYFTRRLGGLLIAIALSFYLILPLMYVFWNAVLFAFTSPWLEPSADKANLTEIGTNMMRVDVSYSNVNVGLVQPNKGVLGYSKNCANGIIEEEEECNELDDTPQGTKYGPPHQGSFTCPPKDDFGNVIPDREEDIYCDTNACKCTSNLFAGLSGSFRDDFLKGKTNDARIDEAAELTARMCFEMQNERQEKDWENYVLDDDEFMTYAKKVWWQKLLQGYGGGIARSIPGNPYLFGANGTIDNIAKLFVFSLVSPFISLMVALSSVKIMSPTLGGDVEIAGLTRLI
ncbi:MAG: hypothetical protein ABIH83_03960 [Candidatus Micrarchaeota archaeon]